MIKLYRGRPLGVSILILMVIIVSIFNFIRLGSALRNWEFLSELLSSPKVYSIFPAYLAVSGLVWGVVGVPLIWGLWTGKSWAPRYYLAAFLCYSLYYWIDRLFLSGYPQRNSNWKFIAGVNLLVLLCSIWVITRKRTRYFFGESHE